jgi:hypothetical protein
MMNNNELYNIVGGNFNISSTLIGSIYRDINCILDLGRTFGTSLRMLFHGQRC